MTERRFDPTTGEWRMFASHRQDRTFFPSDAACPLCPTRPGGALTEIPLEHFEVAVFENRFPALLREPPAPHVTNSALYPVLPSLGANEVIVYSDEHDVGLVDMTPERIAKVIEVWAERYAQLSRRPEVGYVFIFENRGAAVGVTLDHPHGQIYAYPDLPPRAQLELEAGLAHLATHGTCVFCDVVTHELAEGVRVVAANDHVVAYVPFAARFPYEVHVVARRHAPSILDLDDPERLALAGLLKRVLTSYDALFGFPLPYVMSMHQEPAGDGGLRAVSHFHIEFTPLHRSATKLKYLAGSELGAGAFINDTAPEETAARLRACGTG